MTEDATVPCVTVYAASSRRVSEPYRVLASELGLGIAERGWTLIYGGANVGLMGACADAALAAGGRVEGVILDTFARVAHRGLHALEYVDDMRSRKRGLAHRGSAYVVLPGGFGTLEELSEILVERQLALHRRPLIVVNPDGFWDALFALFQRMQDEALIPDAHLEHVSVVRDAGEALSMLDRALPA